jgi:TolB-like protein
MNAKKPLTILLFATLIMFANAADKPQSTLTVAVYDFKGDAEAASYGNNVTTLVTANLTAETNLVMVERSELNKALGEQAFGLSGMVSADAAAKIGQITGAKVLVFGQVMKTGDNHLIIVANIIGTETGRLFADKVEGEANNLTDLTSDLSRKIAQTITAQSTNLVTVASESHEELLNRIVKSVTGTNRPSVSVKIYRHGKPWGDLQVETELQAILMKAAFTVVDDNSENKPEVIITGAGEYGAEPRQGGLRSCNYAMDVKIQDRRTGKILALEHQEGNATEAGQSAARTAAQINAADGLAGKILPLLAN